MAFFSGIASNKADVAILFNNNFTFKGWRQIHVCDKEGRYIVIDLEVSELILTICNNIIKDDPIFFQNVHE